MLRFIFLIIIIAIVTSALGQLMPQYLFTHIASRDGLASDETMGVQQDEKGFIWIATLDGLQRYDGNGY
ncbi:MAG: hypothetical protein WKI04_01090 [Ferruginibacter sp.]